MAPRACARPTVDGEGSALPLSGATGPALIGVCEIVGALSRVLKRPVRAFNAPEWLLNKVAAYRYGGEMRYDLAVFRHYLVDHRQGAFALGGATDAVLETTGRPAESLDQTVRTYATRPEAQRRVWRGRPPEAAPPGRQAIAS